MWNDIEAERNLVSCVFEEWDNFFEVSVPSEVFSHLLHRRIWDAFRECADNNRVGDFTVVSEMLSDGGLFEQDKRELAELYAGRFIGANVKYFAERVLGAWQRLKVTEAAKAISDRIEDRSVPASLLVQDAMDILQKTETANSGDIATGKDVFQTVADEIEEACTGKKKGLQTGFPTLDSLTGGLQKGDLIVIGARPSVGKSALAITMMSNILEQNRTAGFFSLEMPKEDVVKRLLAIQTGISLFDIRTGTQMTCILNKIATYLPVMCNQKFNICDVPNINLDRLVGTARQMVYKAGCEVIFVDYIGLVSTSKNYRSVWEQVSEVTKVLKGLARELHVPIVALSQLGREAEGNMPTLANFRGSGSVEQDADVALILHREREKNKENALLKIAKQRNGPLDNVELAFNARSTKFYERSVNNYEKHRGNQERFD